MAERKFNGGAALLAVVWASLGAVACTASSGERPAGGNDAVTAGDAGADDAGTCQTGGLPTDTYAPNLQKVGKPASGNPAGDAGSFTFILESDEIMGAASSPAEPFVNVFTLKLVDSSGQPVKDATVTLPTNNQALGWTPTKNPWMPLHGHGSSITPTVTNNGDGTYSISTYFFMAGLWQIYIVAQTAGASPVTDSAEYSFCLQ